MSSLVNYIQPNKFISFDNAKSTSVLILTYNVLAGLVNTSKSARVMQFFLPFFFSVFTEKNKSYVISSFVETKGEAMIAKTAVEFVEYPLRVLQIKLQK